MARKRDEWTSTRDQKARRRSIVAKIEERRQVQPYLTENECARLYKDRAVSQLENLMRAVRGVKNMDHHTYLILADDTGRMASLSQLVLKRSSPKKSDSKIVRWNEDAEGGIMVDAGSFLSALSSRAKTLGEPLRRDIAALTEKYGLQTPTLGLKT